MDAYTRLVECGIDPVCAADSIAWYRQQGNDSGLEEYIQNAESRHKRHVCVLQ